MKNFFFLLGVAAVLCGCEQKKTQPTLHEQAEKSFFKACTNEIIGLNRIINYTIRDWDSQPSNWTAEVTAEYVNPVGGITRTNVPFIFIVSKEGNYIDCVADSAKIYQQRIKQIESINARN